MNTKSNNLKAFILIGFLIGFGLSQEFQNQQIPFNTVPNGTGFTQSILNPNRLTTNQSVSFIMTSGNGISQSTGVFSNNFNYRISDQINVNSNIHLISPLVKSFNDPNPFQIKYDVNLDYQISNSFNFNLKLSNYNSCNTYNFVHSPLYRITHLPE